MQAAVANPTLVAEMSHREAEQESSQRERRRKGEKRGGKGKTRGVGEDVGVKKEVGVQLRFLSDKEVCYWWWHWCCGCYFLIVYSFTGTLNVKIISMLLFVNAENKAIMQSKVELILEMWN